MKKPDETKTRRDNDGLHRRRGVWYYCLTIAGARRFFSTRTSNYKEARKVRADAIKQQLENRLPTDLAKLLFEKLLVQVREDRQPHLAEKTIQLEKERSGPLLKYDGNAAIGRRARKPSVNSPRSRSPKVRLSLPKKAGLDQVTLATLAETTPETISRQTLANGLGSGGANGGFNPLYQIGGPRSIQLALKLQF